MNTTAQSATNKRPKPVTYLILQGLGSPFFREVAQLLAADGSQVHRVNYCGGDWWFSGGAKNHRFNDKPEKLEPFYRKLIEKHAVTTILLFGDCRPVHKAALSVAKDMAVTAWVFEEGYTRPGFITCEKSGTNDFSALPRTPEALKARARQIEETDELSAPALPNPLPRRVRMDFAHHFWNLLLKPIYFRHQTHRPESMGAEIRGWLSRFRRKLRFKNMNTSLIKRYENPEKPFFMVPLQLNSDFQIREHSDYASVLDFIREIVASFARHAPKKALLMFKGHPLDNGLIDYRSYIAMAAVQHGIDGRVDYLEGGDLDCLLKRAEGLVLINSTVGYAALRKAKPMKVMGRGLYDMQGLTEQRPLDKFWEKPSGVDLGLVTDFLRVIKADSQVPGDFFTKTGINMAAKGATCRIKADTKEK